MDRLKVLDRCLGVPIRVYGVAWLDGTLRTRTEILEDGLVAGPAGFEAGLVKGLG